VARASSQAFFYARLQGALPSKQSCIKHCTHTPCVPPHPAPKTNTRAATQQPLHTPPKPPRVHPGPPRSTPVHPGPPQALARWQAHPPPWQTRPRVPRWSRYSWP
jgi:hypothetical protein